MPRFYCIIYFNQKGMKKSILVLASLAFVGMQAQETGYNKWSIDVNGGVNKPVSPFANGYSTATPNLWSASLGVRYMANNKFGVRLGGGYDSFSEKEDTPKFDSNMWNVNLQGVANLARVLSFEEWTSDLGLLFHAGGGYAQLSSDYLSKADRMVFITAGLTPQLRISNRIALLLDGSVFINAKQNVGYDTQSVATKRVFQGLHFTGTIGLNIALGKQGRHADWAASAAGRTEEGDIAQRLAALESNVADLKGEVANKQNKMNDANGNRIPDEIESYLNDNYQAKGAVASNGQVSGDVATDLIKKGYISAYFDFNSSVPQVSSSWAVDFVAKYLKENTNAQLIINGYADELGGTNYNASLSQKRADAVKDLLVKAGINASRITAQGKGVDNTVDKGSPKARQLARKATFSLK